MRKTTLWVLRPVVWNFKKLPEQTTYVIWAELWEGKQRLILMILKALSHVANVASKDGSECCFLLLTGVKVSRGQRWEKALTFEPWTKRCFYQVPLSSASFGSSLTVSANGQVSHFPGWNVRTFDVFSTHELLELHGHKRAAPPASFSPSAPPHPPAWSHVTLCELGHSWGHSFWQSIQSMWFAVCALQKVHLAVLETPNFPHILYNAQQIYEQSTFITLVW